MRSTRLRDFSVTELVEEIFPQIINKVKLKQKDKVTLILLQLQCHYFKACKTGLSVSIAIMHLCMHILHSYSRAVTKQATEKETVVLGKTAKLGNMEIH